MKAIKYFLIAVFACIAFSCADEMPVLRDSDGGDDDDPPIVIGGGGGGGAGNPGGGGSGGSGGGGGGGTPPGLKTMPQDSVVNIVL